MLPYIKIVILVVLAGLGIALELTGIIDSASLIAAARHYGEHWWLGILLVAIQSVLFTFALAGSSLVWLTAVIFTPWISTLILVAGTSLGSISAYLFSRRLSDEWAQKVKHTRMYTLLQKQSSLYTLLALRLMPGFPHSVINYSSGILKISLASFVPAVIAGSAIKSCVYSMLIYRATTPAVVSGEPDYSSVWSLMAVSLLMLAYIAGKRYLSNK